MMPSTTNDLDHLAARVHGRRSRLIEAERLDAACQFRALSDVAHAVFPGVAITTAAAFQRHTVQAFVDELSGLRAALTGANGRLLEWLLVRFQMENLKALLRGCLAKLPFEACHPHLVELPRDLALHAKPLAEAASLQDFAQLMPRSAFRQCLERAAAHEPRLFFCEAALDQTYFQELIRRAGQVLGEDQEVVAALTRQEADTFHVMLVARGRFHYERKREELLPFHVAGTSITRARFADMLAEDQLRAAMTRAVGRALDELPAERGTSEPALGASTVEALAWRRFVRLARRAFRHGHVGLGAVVGYVGLHRAEIANLITLSEGLRLGVASDVLRGRMIPRADLEATHV